MRVNPRWTVFRGAWLLATACGLAALTPAGAQTHGDALAGGEFSRATNVVPRYKAVVIGINRYEQPPPAGWDNLVTARADAESMARLLQDQYGFDVTLLCDELATRNGIVAELDNVLSQATADDAILLYFAGHGFFDQDMTEGFWIPADARRRIGDRGAKQDWIWNSMLLKMIGASEARHVLVMADSCYSGALFRGSDLRPGKQESMRWYAQALLRPSRYLITSGDLEPVADTGKNHSIFAQALLNILAHPEQPVISASEIGVRLRDKVSALTGQMPRMGTLQVASDAGGEFVFLASADAATNLYTDSGMTPAAWGRGGESTPVAAATARPEPPRAALGDAALLFDQGATNAAGRVVQQVLRAAPDDPLARAVAGCLAQPTGNADYDRLRDLIARLEQRKAAAAPGGDPAATSARPRILACMGPDSLEDTTSAESTAILLRMGLTAALKTQGRVTVVERAEIANLLQEMDLGASSMARDDLALRVGRLMPASFLLEGVVVYRGGSDQVMLRVVDTESSEILGVVEQRLGRTADLMAACNSMATEIANILTRNNGPDGLTTPLGRDHKEP